MKIKITLSLVVCFLFFANSFAQIFPYPIVKSKTSDDVFIKSISIGEHFTRVDFIVKCSEKVGHYIFLEAPGTENAMFLKANNKIYKLLQTIGISNKDGITEAHPGISVEFSAKFEKIPAQAAQIDIIEGNSGSWNFYGVKLINPIATQPRNIATDKPEISTTNSYELDYYSICKSSVIRATWNNLIKLLFTDMSTYKSLMNHYNYSLMTDGSGYIANTSLGSPYFVINKTTKDISIINSANEGFASSFRKELRLLLKGGTVSFEDDFEIYRMQFEYDDFNYRIKIGIKEDSNGEIVTLILQ